jgi:DNA-binding transcriptional ArsR family regulator
VTRSAPRPALRALRHEPLLVDDRAVAARLGRVGSELTDEVSRWARAWLVCWHAALVADERYGATEPWSIALPPATVAVPKGGGDAGRRALVLDALDRAGVLVRDGGSGSETVRVARDLFTEHRAAVAVDWATVVTACGAEPAALLVLRALAELVVPLDAFTAVPRRDLVARSGYRQKQVRVALRRLAAARLIDVAEDVGTTARYRLAARALGQHWLVERTPPASAPSGGAAPAAPAVPPPVTGGAAPTPAASARPLPAAPSAGANGVRVVVGGVSVSVAAGAAFAVGAGLSASVELGPDGQPLLRITVPDPGT